MNNEQFDRILKQKLERIRGEYEPGSWDALDSKLDAELQPEDTVFDEAVGDKLSSVNPVYNQAHWELMENALDSDMPVADEKFDEYLASRLAAVEGSGPGNSWSGLERKRSERQAKIAGIVGMRIVEVLCLLLLICYWPVSNPSIPNEAETSREESQLQFAGLDKLRYEDISDREFAESVSSQNRSLPLSSDITDDESQAVLQRAEYTAGSATKPRLLPTDDQRPTANTVTPGYVENSTSVDNDMLSDRKASLARVDQVATIPTHRVPEAASVKESTSNAYELELGEKFSSAIVSKEISSANALEMAEDHLSTTGSVMVVKSLHTSYQELKSLEHSTQAAIDDWVHAVPVTRKSLDRRKLSFNPYISADFNAIHSYPRINQLDETSLRHLTLTPGAGLGLGFHNGPWSVHTGLAYAYRFYDPNIQEKFGSINGYQVLNFNKVALHMIQLPISLHFKIHEGMKFNYYLTGGASLHVILRQDYDKPKEGVSEIHSLTTITEPVLDQYRSGNFLGRFHEVSYVTADLGFGVERKLNEDLFLYVQPIYQHMFGAGVGPNFDIIHTFSLQVGLRM